MKISISYEVDRDRRYDQLVRQLYHLGAIPVLPSQWILETPRSADEIRADLQRFIDPEDRLAVMRVVSMSSLNLINWDRYSGAA